MNKPTRKPPAQVTEEMFEAIPLWLALGVTSAEIAEIIGTNITSLRVMCSRRGVSLVPPMGLLTKLQPALAQRLRDEAAQRGVLPTQLALDIVAACIEHDLFKAVLGDYDGEDDEVDACAAR